MSGGEQPRGAVAVWSVGRRRWWWRAGCGALAAGGGVRVVACLGGGGSVCREAAPRARWRRRRRRDRRLPCSRPRFRLPWRRVPYGAGGGDGGVAVGSGLGYVVVSVLEDLTTGEVARWPTSLTRRRGGSPGHDVITPPWRRCRHGPGLEHFREQFPSAPERRVVFTSGNHRMTVQGGRRTTRAPGRGGLAFIQDQHDGRSRRTEPSGRRHPALLLHTVALSRSSGIPPSSRKNPMWSGGPAPRSCVAGRARCRWSPGKLTGGPAPSQI